MGRLLGRTQWYRPEASESLCVAHTAHRSDLGWIHRHRVVGSSVIQVVLAGLPTLPVPHVALAAVEADRDLFEGTLDGVRRVARPRQWDGRRNNRSPNSCKTDPSRRTQGGPEISDRGGSNNRGRVMAPEVRVVVDE